MINPINKVSTLIYLLLFYISWRSSHILVHLRQTFNTTLNKNKVAIWTGCTSKWYSMYFKMCPLNTSWYTFKLAFFSLIYSPSQQFYSHGSVALSWLTDFYVHQAVWLGSGLRHPTRALVPYFLSSSPTPSTDPHWRRWNDKHDWHDNILVIYYPRGVGTHIWAIFIL